MNKDMDQLSFCTFPTKHGLQMVQKQVERSTVEFFEHTALCKFEKSLPLTFAFYLSYITIVTKLDIFIENKII